MVRRTWMLAGTLAVAACTAPEPTHEALTPAPELEGHRVTSGRIARAAPVAGGALHVPLNFEENRGQWSGDVEFVARARGYAVVLAGECAELVPPGKTATPVRLRFVGASASAAGSGVDPRAATSNYLLGGSEDAWRTGVRQFGSVVYDDMYPGVDVVYRGDDDRLRFDLVVAPGADLANVGLAVEGVEDLRIDADGSLVAATTSGEFRHLAPVCFQDTPDGRTPVEGSFRMRDDGSVGLALGAHDPSATVTIDPVILYASYFGGSDDENYWGAMDADADGNLLIAGTTSSLDLPNSSVAPGLQQGGRDVYVAKFDPTGTHLWTTYLGGTQDDLAYGVAAGPTGDAYVTGFTKSYFTSPTPGAFQPTKVDAPGRPLTSRSAYVARVSSDGSDLVLWTYLGGDSDEEGYSIDVDAAGSIYVTGHTYSTDFPSTNGLQTTYGNWQDGFLVKMAADGGSIPYGTYFGNLVDNQTDRAIGLAVDDAGHAYTTVLFRTASSVPSDPPTWYPPDSRIVKIDTTAAGAASLVYSLTLSGAEPSRYDNAISVAIDAAGHAYVGGHTASPDFPVPGGAQTTLADEADAFLVKVAIDGLSLEWGTYFGGIGREDIRHIVPDGSEIHVAGTSWVPGGGLPGANPDLPSTPGGGTTEPFVAGFSADGANVLYSGYLGTAGWDETRGLELVNGDLWVMGMTNSAEFPTTTGADDESYNGGFDVFLVRLGESTGPAPTIELITDGEPFHACDTAFDWTAEKQMRFEVVVTEATGPAVATVLPSGAVFDTGQDPPSFTWTPTSLDAGLHQIVFEATGAGGTATCTLDVTVVHDSDGDALPDVWETAGYTHENGTAVTLADLSAYADRADFVELVSGADPDHRDVFVWVDWMDAPDDASHGSHAPDPDALDLVLQSFANAPSQPNPDGQPGVRLHVLVAKTPIAHVDRLGEASTEGYDWTGFDDVTTMPEELTWSFHRAVFAHDIDSLPDAFGNPTHYSGLSREPGEGVASSDFIVSLGADPWNGGTKTQQAGTFQHELGHNLGLLHGGGDTVKWKPNYISVMSYFFQLTGLLVDGNPGTIDFSKGVLPTGGGVLYEGSLVEFDGLAGPGRAFLDSRWNGYGARWWYPTVPSDDTPPGGGDTDPALRSCLDVNQAIDWDCTKYPQGTETPGGNIADNKVNPSPYKVLLTGPGRAQSLAGHDDWANLVFTGGRVGGGISLPLPRRTQVDELTVELARLIAPDPPGGFKARAAGKQVVLTWKPLGPRNEWTYRVWRAIGDGDPVVIATTQNSNYQDRDAPRRADLTYTITAIDALGVESRASEAIEASLR